jgi:hypothetical protein
MQKMALFTKSDPESVLVKSISDERALHSQLEARLVSARKTATDCQIAARNATRTLADDKIDALEQKEIAAERRVANLSSEIADSDSRLADLETQLAVAADQRIRKATALEVEKIAEGFTGAAANTIAALAALVKQTERMVTFMPDAQGLHIFASKVQGELPANVAMLTTLLRNHTNAVLHGGVQATLPQPAPPPAPLPKPAPVTQVCALKAVAYFDTAGIVQTASRGTDISLSPQTAKHAIAINACCAMDDPRRRTARERQGLMVGKPLRRNCVDLDSNMPPDNEAEPFAPEPIMRSAPANTPDPRFEIVQRGPARQVQVEGARHADLEAFAARNKDSKP